MPYAKTEQRKPLTAGGAGCAKGAVGEALGLLSPLVGAITTLASFGLPEFTSVENMLR